ncbi:hypothetical protein LDENG_00249180 [Lucifuga dentata]|nr:hypothetical protein LDENG_00249180 [Lucifuga dentata]
MVATVLTLLTPVPHGVEGGPTHCCIRNELRVENYLVTLLDVGGSVESWGAWRELCGAVYGIIFVVDSSDRQRIKEVKEVLTDLLKQPRVAGKPILVLANKQDKMNALLGSELIEILSLEKLVNQSRSLCHILKTATGLWHQKRGKSKGNQRKDAEKPRGNECDPASLSFDRFIGQKTRRKRQRVKGNIILFETCCQRRPI